MSKPPYLLGTKSFTNKEDIKDHVRSVRKSMSEGQTLTDPVVLALLRTHPHWSHKTVDMHRIVAATLMIEGRFPKKGFMVERLDGSRVDIKWNALVTALLPGGALKAENPDIDHIKRVEAAARLAIRPQIDALHAPAGHDVHHAAPLTFQVLLRDFLQG